MQFTLAPGRPFNKIVIDGKDLFNVQQAEWDLAERLYSLVKEGFPAITLDDTPITVVADRQFWTQPFAPAPKPSEVYPLVCAMLSAFDNDALTLSYQGFWRFLSLFRATSVVVYNAVAAPSLRFVFVLLLAEMKQLKKWVDPDLDSIAANSLAAQFVRREDRVTIATKVMELRGYVLKFPDYLPSIFSAGHGEEFDQSSPTIKVKTPAWHEAFRESLLKAIPGFIKEKKDATQFAQSVIRAINGDYSVGTEERCGELSHRLGIVASAVHQSGSSVAALYDTVLQLHMAVRALAAHVGFDGPIPEMPQAPVVEPAAPEKKKKNSKRGRECDASKKS